MLSILRDGFGELGLELTESAAERFAAYFSALEAGNKVMNLTAITGREDVARLHFLDSAGLCSVYDFGGKSVIDVGSGAGFPGLVLKIVCPDLRLTLLDSLKKRVDFLRSVCDELGFEDVSCVNARAEQAAELFGLFDAAVSRAVARLNLLCELCLPFVKKGGVFIAMKGAEYQNELDEAQNAINLLGGGESEVRSYAIPGTDRVTRAVIIPKVADTPAGYPRPFPKMKKTPL